MGDGKYMRDNSENSSAEKREGGVTKSILGYIHDLVYLLGAILVVFLILLRVVVVSGPSMQNTLVDGDYLLLIGKPFYTNPAQGDIIVAAKESFENGTPIIKRIIATEGQTVDINFDTGEVMVDGNVIDEPYIKALTTLSQGTQFPLVVDPGCVFVMGDNRMNSTDSRSPAVGQIDTREILGRAVFLFLPGNNGGKIERDYSRIGALS